MSGFAKFAAVVGVIVVVFAVVLILDHPSKNCTYTSQQVGMSQGNELVAHCGSDRK